VVLPRISPESRDPRSDSGASPSPPSLRNPRVFAAGARRLCQIIHASLSRSRPIIPVRVSLRGRHEELVTLLGRMTNWRAYVTGEPLPSSLRRGARSASVERAGLSIRRYRSATRFPEWESKSWRFRRSRGVYFSTALYRLILSRVNRVESRSRYLCTMKCKF